MDFTWMKKVSSKICDKEWEQLSQKYVTLKVDLEDIQYRLEKVRSRMIEMVEGENSYGKKVFIFHRNHKGHIDLGKLREAVTSVGIDMEDYRMKSYRKPYFYIMHRKQEENIARRQ